MEKYIEDKKISTVEIVEGKQTPAGHTFVKVNFEDGTSEEMPSLRLDTISTDKISDATSVRDVLKQKVASYAFATLHEYGVKMGEVNSILDLLTELVNNGYTKASDYLWGATYVNTSLNQVNSILLKNDNTKIDNGTASTGSGANQVDTE